MPSMGPYFNVHTAFTAWEFSPFPLFILLLCVAVAIWYLNADWTLASRGRSWSRWRTLSFMCGLASVDLALQSPVAAFTGHYFEAHVLQHMLLMVAGPPLLALGAPSTLLLQTSSRTLKTRWLKVLRSQPFRLVSHPITVFFMYYGAMFVFFLTSLITVAMTHMWLMDLINLFFFLGATFFWWPMVGIDPIIHNRLSYPARLGNLLLGSAVEAFLGIAILSSAHPIASMYTLASTHAGGAMLWTITEVVTLGGVVPIYFQWIRSEERVGAREDARSRKVQPVVVPVALAGTIPGSVAPSSAWEEAWIARTGTLPLRSPTHVDLGAELSSLEDGLATLEQRPLGEPPTS